MQDQTPHQHALRRGRHSQTNARYFVTLCTKPNSPNLTTPETYLALQETINAMTADETLYEVSYTVMPDHAHLLFRLSKRLTLARAIARLKSKTKQLTQAERPDWQSGYYDHKLRNDAEAYPILHYIYINPYKAKLIPTTEAWPYTLIRVEDWKWFQPLLNADCPYPEWLT